ncbi:hypothetical protein CDIK_1121 [Cucumispora dikerogammari]|nr:hypothetical protein CDIK_1121 [Cucumispora dikerogammari]
MIIIKIFIPRKNALFNYRTPQRGNLCKQRKFLHNYRRNSANKSTEVQDSYKYSVSELLNLTERAIRLKEDMKLEDYEFLKSLIKYRKNKKEKKLRSKEILRYLIKKD